MTLIGIRKKALSTVGVRSVTCATWRHVHLSRGDGIKLPLMARCKWRIIPYIMVAKLCRSYKNVRIEPVHYCQREYELAEKRKRKSFINRNADPIDAPKERLVLFMRTVWENRDLAFIVRSLRLPYMTREACKTELARTVSVLRNLRYVDLPEGFSSDDPSSISIKNEMQASCPDIRRLKYSAGSERSFTKLPTAPLWQNLQMLELAKLHIETQDLLFVLATFSRLQDLKLVELRWLDDNAFRHFSSSVPAFPPLRRLTFQDTPQIQAAGLATYLSQRRNQEALEHLSLSMTGVLPQHLYAIINRAPRLLSLSIIDNVDRSFPADPPTPQLCSKSLKFLHYEITSHSSPRSPRYAVQPMTVSYYSYLASSLLSGSLPALRELYVRDGSFPELLLSPPTRPFSDSPLTQSFTTPKALDQPLAVYSKGLEEMEWNFTSMEPASELNGRRGSMSETRPLSFSGVENLGPAWGGHARKSVVVGNGFGGFLAVPSDDAGRPSSSGSWNTNKKERKDLWR